MIETISNDNEDKELETEFQSALDSTDHEDEADDARDPFATDGLGHTPAEEDDRGRQD